jgi:opacity protein-like surface antigen
VFSGIDRSNRIGFAAGAVCEFPLGPLLWLRAEPMYVQKGSETDWPAGHDDNDNILKLDYLVLALNIKAVIDYGAFSPFVFAGPYIGQPISDKNVLKSDGSTQDANMQGLDLGFDFGAGADYRLNEKMWMTIDARYSLGLKDVDDYNGASFRNRGMLVLAGLSFGL